MAVFLPPLKSPISSFTSEVPSPPAFLIFLWAEGIEIWPLVLNSHSEKASLSEVSLSLHALMTFSITSDPSFEDLYFLTMAWYSFEVTFPSWLASNASRICCKSLKLSSLAGIYSFVAFFSSSREMTPSLFESASFISTSGEILCLLSTSVYFFIHFFWSLEREASSLFLISFKSKYIKYSVKVMFSSGKSLRVDSIRLLERNGRLFLSSALRRFLVVYFLGPSFETLKISSSL